MSIWSRIKKRYKKIDRRVGGVLPGGVSRTTTTSTSKPTSTTTSSHTSGGSSSHTSGGSSSHTSGGSSSHTSGGSSSHTSGGSSNTVPYNFVGPLQPGTTREPEPAQYQGPVRPGTNEQIFRNTGRISSNTSSSGGSSSHTSGGSSNTQQITGALATATANQNVYNYDQQKANAGKLGVTTTSNPLTDSWYKGQQSSTGSYAMPDYNIIKKEEKAGNISKDTALKSMGVYYGQEYQSHYERDSTAYNKKIMKQANLNINKAQDAYQGRIDAGEDYTTVNKEFQNYIDKINKNLTTNQNTFNTNWEATTGVEYKGKVNRILYDQTLLYDSEKAKSKVFSQFTKGAVTGAVTTGGFMGLSKIAPRVTKVGSKFVAAPVMIGYGIYAYGSSGYSGYKNYEKAKELGFTTTESIQRGLLGGANTLSGPAFYSAGAVTGGLAVTGGAMAYRNLKTTGRFTGYTTTETARINKLLGRKDALKIDLKKGQVTDATLKNKGGSVTGSTSIRSYTVKLNMYGLSGKDLAVANKFNLRGTVNQHLTGTGKSLGGYETGEFKTGGYFGKTTNTFTKIQGVINNGKVMGFTSTLSNTGRITNISMGIFKSSGQVKTPNIFTRLEGSRTTGQDLFKVTYTRDPTKLIQFGKPSGKWTGYSGPSSSRNSAVNIESSLKEINIIKTNSGLFTGKTYNDVAEWNFNNDPGFTVTKTSGSKGIGGFSSSGSGTATKLTQIKTTQTIAPVTTTSITAPVTYQATSHGFLSAYAGTGKYELTQPETMRGALNPSRTSQLTRTSLLPPTSLQEPVIAITTGHNIKSNKTFSQPKQVPRIQHPIVSPVTRQLPRNKQAGRTLTGTTPTLPLTPILTGGYGFNPRTPKPTRPSMFPPIPLPLGAWGRAKYGAIGGKKSRTGYTPSVTALFFKIRGKKPKKRNTGFNFRPIVNGKVRRVKKVKK